MFGTGTRLPCRSDAFNIFNTQGSEYVIKLPLQQRNSVTHFFIIQINGNMLLLEVWQNTLKKSKASTSHTRVSLASERRREKVQRSRQKPVTSSELCRNFQSYVHCLKMFNMLTSSNTHFSTHCIFKFLVSVCQKEWTSNWPLLRRSSSRRLIWQIQEDSGATSTIIFQVTQH